LGGRITTADLYTKNPASDTVSVPNNANVQIQETQSETEKVKLTNIRKVIAKAMYNSISTTCQLTLNSSFDVTEIMEFRKKLKAGKDKFGLENITLNDIVLYAVSRTLLNFKDLNAHFLDDSMLYFKNVNLGVAIDTDRGLMVPTLFNANLKSLNEISSQVKALAKECQSGSINPDLLKDGSFTVTNLGTLDIESFTPILNAPQTGILGVNNITQRAKEVDGEIVFYPAMGLSLTFDHRAIDGAPAGKFLQALKYNLENFSCLLAK
jgi:pyruvate dehydrogenase E2 component (dihydrolipoamide acetyltransferase)